MSDRVKLAREIAARTKPRFVDTNPERPKAVEGMRKLARAIAAGTETRFITIPPQRGGGRVHFTEEQLTALPGGLTVEEYRWLLIENSWSAVITARINNSSG